MSRGKKTITGLVGLCVVFLAVSFFLLPALFPVTYSALVKSVADVNAAASSTPAVPQVPHVATPASVKAIYMSACAASSPSFRAELENLIETTELNSVVIDIKDYTGMLSFEATNPELQPYISTNCVVKDMPALIADLHSHNIYVIGRLTTFQDPYYTKLHPEAAIHKKSDGTIWTDTNGLSYIDPSSKEAWQHVIDIANDAHDIGFDEINFDYIRYPSDGEISNMAIPAGEQSSKSAVLESFFQYLQENLGGKMKISADLFGMTTTAQDDMGIGQILEGAMPYFDYIDPMVYPSHYPPDFNGWSNPNAVPYDLIHFVLGSAVARIEATTTTIKTLGETLITAPSSTSTASTTKSSLSLSPLYAKVSYSPQKIRPWLQDFTLGEPAYTAADVRAQIQATYDDGLGSWLIWNAANKYTSGAFLPHASSSVSGQ